MKDSTPHWIDSVPFPRCKSDSKIWFGHGDIWCRLVFSGSPYHPNDKLWSISYSSTLRIFLGNELSYGFLYLVLRLVPGTIFCYLQWVSLRFYIWKAFRSIRVGVDVGGTSEYLTSTLNYRIHSLRYRRSNNRLPLIRFSKSRRLSSPKDPNDKYKCHQWHWNRGAKCP